MFKNLKISSFACCRNCSILWTICYASFTAFIILDYIVFVKHWIIHQPVCLHFKSLLNISDVVQCNKIVLYLKAFETIWNFTLSLKSLVLSEFTGCEVSISLAKTRWTLSGIRNKCKATIINTRSISLSLLRSFLRFTPILTFLTYEMYHFSHRISCIINVKAFQPNTVLLG